MTTIDVLDSEYSDARKLFGEKARKCKNAFLLLWYLSTGSVWLTLLATILGLALPKIVKDFGLKGFNVEFVQHVLLTIGVPVLSGIVMLCTLAQLLFKFDVKWRSYRAAAEHLKNAGLRYRVGLKPFDGDNAEEELSATFGQIKSRAGKGDKWLSILGSLFGKPGVTTTSSLPYEGLHRDVPLTSEKILAGRLYEQRAWFAAKARKYVLSHLGFQFLIMLIAVLNVVYSKLQIREFWVVGVMTTLSLGVIAWRDFMDLATLAFRYLETATELDELAKQHATCDFDVATLMERTERILQKEQELWYLHQGGLRSIDRNST